MQAFDIIPAAIEGHEMSKRGHYLGGHTIVGPIPAGSAPRARARPRGAAARSGASRKTEPARNRTARARDQAASESQAPEGSERSHSPVTCAQRSSRRSEKDGAVAREGARQERRARIEAKLADPVFQANRAEQSSRSKERHFPPGGCRASRSCTLSRSDQVRISSMFRRPHGNILDVWIFAAAGLRGPSAGIPLAYAFGGPAESHGVLRAGRSRFCHKLRQKIPTELH